MAFLDKNYLLRGATARKLFAEVGELPVVDPHNHANVAELAKNDSYKDMWQLFAATDHYVWEVLRKRGVPEKFITGDAPSEEKWLRMASVFPEIAGNPVYEWVHLDLRRGLGIDKLLSERTAAAIWKEGNKKLATAGKKPLALLDAMNVEVMCSTDDPLDVLAEHDEVNRKAGRTLVRPTWRPDKAMKIAAPSWRRYVESLEERYDRKIDVLDDLLEVLRESHDYFHEKGCRASDHGLESPLAGQKSTKAEKIFRRVYHDGEQPSPDKTALFMSHVLGEMCELNAHRGWVTQLHIGAVRDVRRHLFTTLGPDSGGDVSNHFLDLLTPLKEFLNRFDDRLKVVLYCLEPGHQATLATVARAFGEKVRLGSAWWLCDTPVGMRRQLEYIGSVDLLSNFAGMVSDSRKLLSYQSRFEMFRRVLCDVIGQMVDDGQIPMDLAVDLAGRMCYAGPKEFWGI